MNTSRRHFLGAGGGAFALSALGIPLSAALGSSLRVSREALASDPLRPQFHLLPTRNWMNDPDGPVYWNGHYHMFYQYNPNAAVWGDMHWAHAVSPDMIRWRHLPVALAPTPGGYDAEGCFTGSAVDDQGTATLIYTGVTKASPEHATLRDGAHSFREVQCLAWSRDSMLKTWSKLPEPVLLPPSDPQLAGFRDPCLWRDEETWFMGVGSGQKQAGGRVLLYKSLDLRKWEYLHPLANGRWSEKANTNLVDSGEMWECPDFFELDGKHVLFYSTEGKVIWEVGDFDRKDLRFHAQKRGQLDYGAYYAPKSQLDSKRNRILWGWIPESRAEREYSAAGWAGCMSLPRVLSVKEATGTLGIDFAAEATTLRRKPRSVREGLKHAEKSLAIRGMEFPGAALEVQLRIASNEFRLELVGSKSTIVTLGYDPSRPGEEFSVNGKRAPLSRTGELFIHVFLDGSVVEAIANQEVAITARSYHAEEITRFMIPEPSVDVLKSLDVWEIQPISADRLTT